MKLNISSALIAQGIAFVLACGVTISTVRTQGAVLEQHAVVLQHIEQRLDDHDTQQASNTMEHKYIIKQLDNIDAKLDPIIEIAIRGNEHMKHLEVK
jgi:hypothetical protein